MRQSLIELGQNRAVHRTVLKNGMVVLMVENPAADIIAARVFVRAGSHTEPRHQAGLSQLVSAVLTKGTDRLSSLEIAERVESVGASLGADAAADYFLLSLKTVSADFAEMLELMGELLRSPTFPQEEVDLERHLTLQAIRSQQEQPFTVAFDQLRHAMYRDHPYALPGLGMEETVAQLKREDLQAYHQAYFRPDNMVISLVGRIVPQAALDLVEQVFGNWQTSAIDPPALSIPPVVANPCQSVTAQETQQSIIMLGYLTPSVLDQSPAADVSDYTTLKLLNTYLGNGLSSRLFVELREKRGLPYEVSAFFPTRLYESQFVVYMGTAPDNTAIALEGLTSEVERLCHTRIDEEDLQATKNKLLGQYALGKQTNAQIAQILGWYETLGLGVEFDTRFQEEVATVSCEMAQTVAQKYFAEPYLSLVGPAAVVRESAVPATLGS